MRSVTCGIEVSMDGVLPRPPRRARFAKSPSRPSPQWPGQHPVQARGPILLRIHENLMPRYFSAPFRIVRI